MFLHHFWPFLEWFGVILGCFERVLVIFGPRNAFKWPFLGSKMAQKRAKNRFPQKWFTSLLTLWVCFGPVRLCWGILGLFLVQNDPKRPKTTQNGPKMAPKWPQNDPKMTPKWPQNDPKMTPKSIFSKMFLHHFWPCLGWFGVILGCFERVLVIFGPRNAFKWPYLDSKMAQKRAKNRLSQKWFTSLLDTLGVVWGHFRLLWAVFGLQRPQNDPKTTHKMTSSYPKMTPTWQRGALPTFQAVGG